MRTSSIAISLVDATKGRAILSLPWGVQILGGHVQDTYTLVIDYAYEPPEPVWDAIGHHVEPKRVLVHFQLAKTGEYLSRQRSWCVPVKVSDSQYLFYAFK